MAEIVEVIHRINYEVNDVALIKQTEYLAKLLGQLDKTQVAASKTRTSVSQIGSGIIQGLGMGGGLSGVASAATAAIKDLAIECVKTGIAADRVKQAFDRLNQPGLLGELRIATRGTISDIELMRTALYANKLHVPVENLAAVFVYARKRASETGEAVNDLARDLVQGIGTQSLESLQQLGLSTEKVGAEFSKTKDFAASALKIIAEESKTSGAGLDSLADKADRLNTRFENFKANLGKLLGDVGTVAFDVFTMPNPITGENPMVALERWLDKYVHDDERLKAAARKMFGELVAKYKKEGIAAFNAELARLREDNLVLYNQFLPFINDLKSAINAKPKAPSTGGGRNTTGAGLHPSRKKKQVPDFLSARSTELEIPEREPIESPDKATVEPVDIKPPKMPSKLESTVFGDSADIENPEDRRRAEIKKSIEAYQTLATAAIQTFQSIYDAQIKALDAEISIRQKRVDAATELAKRGNTDALKLEQERLEAAQRQREQFAKKQQVLNAAMAVSSAILAVAQTAGETGPGAIVMVPAVIAAILAGYVAISAATRESSAQAYADGVVDYKGKGGPRDDANWVRISSGESVITAKGTAANRSILEAINKGAEFKMLNGQLVAAVPLTSGNATGFASKQNLKTLEKKLDGVIDAVKDSKLKQDIFFNEHGVGLMTQRVIRRDQNRFK